MARRRLRSQGEIVDRCLELREELRDALERLPEGSGDPGVVDAVWHGEALGALLWVLQLVELPPYDQPFDPRETAGAELGGAELREAQEVVLECESALLWHWRARTADLQDDGALALPDRYASFEALVGATAMHGYEEGLLPPPLRGDFRAYGKSYRHLSTPEWSEAHSLAAERHHALAWATSPGRTWDEIPLDT